MKRSNQVTAPLTIKNIDDISIIFMPFNAFLKSIYSSVQQMILLDDLFYLLRKRLCGGVMGCL